MLETPERPTTRGAEREPPDLPDDLPALTSKQEKFVHGLLAGKTAADAYRAAYDCSEMQPESIWPAASRLRANSKIALWIAAATKAGFGATLVTRDNHLAQLARLRELAIEDKQYTAAAKCEDGRGRVAGLYTTHIEVNHTDPATLLAEIQRLDPELARQLAQRFRVPLTIDDALPVTAPAPDENA